MKAATMDTGTIIESDTKAFETKDKYSAPDLIVHAARRSGRGAFSIGREMMSFSLGKAKLQPSEYVLYALYERERYSQAERQAFISAAMHGKIVYEFNDYGWFDVAGDKWLSSVFLGRDGTPQPETLAVIDTSPRRYQGGVKLSSADALRDFLTGEQGFPLFCKYNNGRWSVGASVITRADETHIHMKGKSPIRYEDFLREYVGSHVFLIQRFVENHPFLKQYTSTTATVRMVNIWRDDRLWTPHAILKLPSKENDADNFWRAGNLVCQLDVETGEVLTVVGRDGPDLIRHEVHPETGKNIIGERLPHWREVLQLNARVAEMHYPVKYQTQDIAITEDGPVEIEFNWGGAFELPQIATGQGFFTEEMREAFRGLGSRRV